MWRFILTARPRFTLRMWHVCCDFCNLSLSVFVLSIPSVAWSRILHSAGILSPSILTRSLSNSRPRSVQSSPDLYWCGNWKEMKGKQTNVQLYFPRVCTFSCQQHLKAKHGLLGSTNHQHFEGISKGLRQQTGTSHLHRLFPLFPLSQSERGPLHVI